VFASLLVALIPHVPDFVASVVAILAKKGLIKPEELADLMIRNAKPGESFFAAVP